MLDVQFKEKGSVTLFKPISPLGKAWVEENLDLEPWQWTKDSFAVESRYVPDVMAGMNEDGLNVEGVKKKAAVPQVPLHAQTTPTVPVTPGAPVPPLTGQPAAAVGESVAVDEQPQQEKHTVPPELPNALFHMAAEDIKSRVEHEGNDWLVDLFLQAQADKEGIPVFSEADKIRLRGKGVIARGGWHRVSMYTLQSDDKRFTITEIDPTRRKNWFLLKDLETGQAYEETTMTSAKGKAKLIRVSTYKGLSTPLQDIPPVVASFKNRLLSTRRESPNKF